MLRVPGGFEGGRAAGGAVGGDFWVFLAHFGDIFVISLRAGGEMHGGSTDRRAACAACGGVVVQDDSDARVWCGVPSF